jgi:hypothetical protein
MNSGCVVTTSNSSNAQIYNANVTVTSIYPAPTNGYITTSGWQTYKTFDMFPTGGFPTGGSLGGNSIQWGVSGVEELKRRVEELERRLKELLTPEPSECKGRKFRLEEE